MANYSTLISAIQDVIKTNGNEEITGALMQQSLLAMINSLGAGYQFMGVATPSTNPGTPDQRVFYLAPSGTYTNFNSLTVPEGHLGVLKYTDDWTLETLPVGKDYDGYMSLIVGDRLVGDDNTLVSGNLIPVTPGHRYRCFISDPFISKSNVTYTTASYVIFDIRALNDSNEVVTTFVSINATQKALALQKYYDIEIPSGATLVQIRMRANSAAEQIVSLVDDTLYNVSGQTDLANELELARPLFVEKSTISDFSSFERHNFIIVSAGTYGTSSSSKHILIPVSPGQRVRIGANNDNVSRVAFFWDIDVPVSGGTTPNVPIDGELSYTIAVGEEAILAVPEGARFMSVNIGTSSTIYTPNAISILESVLESASEQLFDEQEYEGENLENPESVRTGWSIDYRNGCVQKIPSTSKGITDYIPVKGGNLKCQNATTSGSYGGHAVYDENKNYLRGWTGTAGTYTYQEGDYYVRFLVDTTSAQKVITRSTYDIYRNVAYDSPLVQRVFKDESVRLVKANIPDIFPASGLVGEPGKVISADSLSGDKLTITDVPSKLKPNVSLSFFGKITSFGYIEIGQGYGNNTGWGLRITSTNVSAMSYSGGTAQINNTKTHGLTIGTFIFLSVVKEGTTLNVKLTSFGGEYVNSVTLNTLEAYGTPYAYADASTALTSVKFGWSAKELRKAIWFLGASYCSLYEQRMLTQLRNTYGVDSFAIVAEAGNDFAAIWSNLIAALNYGTPKFLVQAIGMNEVYPEVYNYYFKKLENICRERGIVLVPCTIPYPQGGTKEGINNIVKNSGYRYIDLYSAVSSDDNGTWYDGYCDDGTHPTIIGAKAMAAQIMLDLPEILEY